MKEKLTGKYQRLFELAKERTKKWHLKKLRKERMEEMSRARRTRKKAIESRNDQIKDT